MAVSYLAEKLHSWGRRIHDPAFRPELVRRLKRQALRLIGQDKSTVRADLWCQEKAISTQEALMALGYESVAFPNSDIQPVLDDAESRVQKHLQKHYIGPANLELLYTICVQKKPMSVLETGVAHGWSSLIILLALQNRKGAKLISNDLPPTYSFAEDYVGIAVPENLRRQWDLRRAADHEGLTKIKQEGHRFQLAHYDSDKTYHGRLFGYDIIWTMLEPGGILISDDIVDNHAFKDFCAMNDLDPLVIWDQAHEKYEGLVVKPA